MFASRAHLQIFNQKRVCSYVCGMTMLYAVITERQQLFRLLDLETFASATCGGSPVMSVYSLLCETVFMNVPAPPF